MRDWFILVCFGVFRVGIIDPYEFLGFNSMINVFMGSHLSSVAQNSLVTSNAYISIIFKESLNCLSKEEEFNSDILSVCSISIIFIDAV